MSETIIDNLPKHLAFLQRPTYRNSISDIGCKSGLTIDGAKDLIEKNLDLKRDEVTGLWYYGADKAANNNWRYGLTFGHFEVFWPSGRVLAEIMSDNPLTSLITNKHVLSIGAGSDPLSRQLTCRPDNISTGNGVTRMSELELAINKSKKLLGTLISVASPAIAESLSTSGLDFLFFDLEHYVMSLADVQAMIQATQRTCLSMICIANPQAVYMKQAFDTGCDCLVVPQVNSAKIA